MPARIRVTARERECIIHEERKRRQVARLLQVRDQSEQIAHAIREDLASEEKMQEKLLRIELEKRIAAMYSSELHASSIRRRSSVLPKSIEKVRRKSTTKEDSERARMRYRLAREAMETEKLREQRKKQEVLMRKQAAQREANALCRAGVRRE